jgi:hypothetical protein
VYAAVFLVKLNAVAVSWYNGPVSTAV